MKKDPGTARPKKHKFTLTCSAVILLVFHFPIIITIILDRIQPSCFSGLLKTFYDKFELLHFLLNFNINCDMTGTLLSSILVVWTFITAVIIFYMERRENLYCGMRMWDIVSYDLKKPIKISLAVLFFLELGVILTASIVHLPLTLGYFSLLYPVTAGCTLGFVSWATSDRTIRKKYFALISREYMNKHNWEKETFTDELPSITRFLNILSFSGEKELDILLDILLTVFLPPCKSRSRLQRIEAEKAFYLMSLHIIDKLKSNRLIKDFFKSLAVSAYKELASEERKIDILTAMSFPLLTIKGDASHYISFLSVIPDSSVQHDLILYGAVFTQYLDQKTGSNLYQYTRMDLFSHYRIDFTTADRAKVISFQKKINEIDRDAQLLTDIFNDLLKI